MDKTTPGHDCDDGFHVRAPHEEIDIAGVEDDGIINARYPSCYGITADDGLGKSGGI